MTFRPHADPLDIELGNGVRVRDLATIDECTSALIVLEEETGRILSQISRAEFAPDSVEPGWRTRAQGALRWKKRARRAINLRIEAMSKGPSQKDPADVSEKRRAILKTIRQEVGEVEYDRMVALAQARNPHLDWSAP